MTRRTDVNATSRPTVEAASVIRRLRAAGCVFAEDEAQLLISAAATDAELATLVDQRVAGLPLEHLLGWAEFCGRRIAVSTGVFVPRRRTEFLVRQAAAAARHPAPVLLDLCCGSGAVAAVLAGIVEGAEVHAADLDPVAVRCARRNLTPVGGDVYEGDLFDPLPDRLRGRITVIAANAPYVPTEAITLMPPEARLHETRMALDGGADGLDVQRRIAACAAEWLAPGGRLLIESSRAQAPDLSAAFVSAGLSTRTVGSEEFAATIVIATM